MKTKHEIILESIQKLCIKCINSYFKLIEEEEEEGHHYSDSWFAYHQYIDTYKQILEHIESQTNEN